MAGVWSSTEMSVQISSFELMTYIKQLKMCRKLKESLYVSKGHSESRFPGTPY